MSTMEERFRKEFRNINKIMNHECDGVTHTTLLFRTDYEGKLKDFVRTECERATKEKDKKIKELVEALDHMQHLHDLRVADVNMLKEKRALDSGVISELKEALKCCREIIMKDPYLSNSEDAIDSAIAKSHAVLAKLK